MQKIETTHSHSRRGVRRRPTLAHRRTLGDDARRHEQRSPIDAPAVAADLPGAVAAGRGFEDPRNRRTQRQTSRKNGRAHV